MLKFKDFFHVIEQSLYALGAMERDCEIALMPIFPTPFPPSRPQNSRPAPRHTTTGAGLFHSKRIPSFFIANLLRRRIRLMC